MLLGSFGYKGRLGPMNAVISNNVVRRSRQAAIQYRGAGVDGALIITGNQIVHRQALLVDPCREFLP